MQKNNIVSAIIAAAGAGERMNSKTPKQYLLIDRKPIIAYTLEAIDRCGLINRIFISLQKSDMDFFRQNVLASVNQKKETVLVEGGKTRQESVYNSLIAAKGSDIAVIHDGVRPFVSNEIIEECIKTSQKKRACIVGVLASDTLKTIEELDNSLKVTSTVDRKNFILVQTPQSFEYELLLDAYKKAIKDGFLATDDSLLVERLGIDVSVILGSRLNIKITYPEDIVLAEAILKGRQDCTIKKVKEINN